MMSPMDNAPFVNSPQNQYDQNVMQALQQIQQNPQAFEEQMKRNNPQAYQMACNIRNTSNPREVIIQLANQRGINPNILRMFGLI